MILKPKNAFSMLTYLLAIFALPFLLACGDNNSDDEQSEIDGSVETINQDLVENSLVLAIPLSRDNAYLLNKQGQRVRTYEFNSGTEENSTATLGTDLELLPDGNLLGMFKRANPPTQIGGIGGFVRLLSVNADNTTNVEWSFRPESDDIVLHHDALMLPNGNVIVSAWERITQERAIASGIVTNQDIFPDLLIEYSPSEDRVVWQWRSIEHILQAGDSAADNPQLLDFNYPGIRSGGRITHINAIEYDAVKDIIYASSNDFSEIWVIDHSTTMEQASGSTGGNFGKGGDLIYRFGNPAAYGNTEGQRLFYNNHHVNIIPEGYPGAGNLLVYGNRTGAADNEQSTIYELEAPGLDPNAPNEVTLQAGVDNEMPVVWSFTDPRFFARITGSALRLQNGNTLFSESDYGFWEVTHEGEVVWRFNASSASGDNESYWRGMVYQNDVLDL